MRTLVLFASLAVFSSCSWFGNDEEQDEFAGLSTEEQFYRQAVDRLDSQNFRSAIATYQALESRFPFGRFATQAQIELVYAYYRNNDLEAAIAAADRFIRLSPEDSNVDYAYYMKGLSSFTADRGLIDRFLPTDPSKRDPGQARESFAEFSQLLALYPDSPYSADARARMVYLRNSLAAYEIHVANYYLERRAYIAALNRAKYVVENFQSTPAVSDGISIMIESYLRLGLNDLADTSLAILRENYPQHASLDVDGDFIVRMEVTDPSLLYTATFGLLGDNRGDPSLAPASRPRTSGSQEIINAQDNPEQQDRSWLSVLTLGIFD
ncbi:MAG: outer membrane protein assembly factor BamD [Gammaproteobacteria bacterium]|nr:outer membrane protein assembly factor BamD [Gammaproteobacteria bacterium]